MLTGCGFTYHFQDGTKLRGEEHDQWASFFVFGLIGDVEVDVREACPNGIYEVTTGTNFLTWLVTGLTLAIYSPRKVNIWCAAGDHRTAYEIDFGRDGKPAHVTKRIGSITYSGEARPLADGRYGAWLQEGEAR
jgi:hypothetical protein